MEKKYLKVDFQVKEIVADNDNFVFEGYASTFGNKDLVDDIIEQGAFANSISKDLPVLWQHDYQQPIGILNFTKEDNHGLFVKGALPKADTFVSGRVMPQMKLGSIKKMSIGYSVDKYEIDNDNNIRILKELTLHEVSLVTFPANPLASITDLKKKEFKKLSDIEDYLKLYGISNNESKKIIANIKKIENQREVDQANQRDAGLLDLKAIEELKNIIKEI
jgi:HK97 family phage prohead protease